MNAASHPTPTQRLWLQVHARHAEQPWLLPAALVALLMFVVLLASYVHLVNAQVLRGEKLRAAQRSMPQLHLSHASYEAHQKLVRTEAGQLVPQRMTITTATPVSYTLPSP